MRRTAMKVTWADWTSYRNKQRGYTSGYYIHAVSRNLGESHYPIYLRWNGMWCNLCAPDCYHPHWWTTLIPRMLLILRLIIGHETEDFGYKVEDFYSEKLAKP